MEGSGPVQTQIRIWEAQKLTDPMRNTGCTLALVLVETNLLCLPGSQLWPELDPCESSRFVRYIHSYIILHHDGVSSSVPE
jgi:hypothetical protein